MSTWLDKLPPLHERTRAQSERRKFLAWAASITALAACGRGQEAVSGLSAGPAPRASSALDQPQSNVRDYGALGDGHTNDTAAFGLALDALSGGGLLNVPDGDYLIDPLQSIRLTNNITMEMAPGAILRAIPVAARNSAVILIEKAHNVRVRGGTIIGERYGHLGVGGEGGMGIWVSASADVWIENVLARDCWGDGFYIAGWSGKGSYDANSLTESHSERVTISKCFARNNRRQGLSIVGCVGALVEDSEFTDTNGTLPEAGIDLEPQGNWKVTDVEVRNCLSARNAGWGILVCGNDIYKGMVTRIWIENNQAVENGRDGFYVLRGTTQCTVTGNTIARNGMCGMLFDRTHFNEANSNIIVDNGRAEPGRYPDIFITNGASHNSFHDNRSSWQRRLSTNALPRVVISPDCFDNTVSYSSDSEVTSRRPPYPADTTERAGGGDKGR